MVMFTLSELEYIKKNLKNFSKINNDETILELQSNFKIVCNLDFSKQSQSTLKMWNYSNPYKQFYHAKEDILYFFQTNLKEKKLLLNSLNSLAIHLQNNFCTNFLEIKITQIKFEEIKKKNRFLKRCPQNLIKTYNIVLTVKNNMKVPAK